MADAEDAKDPRLGIEVGKTKFKLYVAQSISTDIPTVWVNTSHGDVAVAYNRTETVSGESVEYAPPTDDGYIEFDTPDNLTFYFFTDEGQARAVAEQGLTGSAINSYIAMNGGGRYGTISGGITSSAISLDSSNFNNILQIEKNMLNVTVQNIELSEINPLWLRVVDTTSGSNTGAGPDPIECVLSDEGIFILQQAVYWNDTQQLLTLYLFSSEEIARNITDLSSVENIESYIKENGGCYFGYAQNLDYTHSGDNGKDINIEMQLVAQSEPEPKLSHGIYQNGKAITPKIKGMDISRVMYNGKVIYPTVTFEPYTLLNVPNGVYIIDTDNLLYPRANWDTANNANAMGVAVISDNCRFAISKVQGGNMAWADTGNNDVLINDIVTTEDLNTAKLDYDGEGNTNKIIAQLGAEYAPAANYCKNTDGLFPDGRQGHLPSLGEWNEAYNNKAEIDACMSLIGGEAINTYYNHWTSTQYMAENSWILYWSDGNVFNNHKRTTNSVRAFLSLKASYTLDEAPNGVYVLSTDNMLYKKEGWDTANNANAVGVAVLSDDCRFVISKQGASEDMIWGSTGTPSGCFMSTDKSAALQDFAGKANTDAVITAYGENANAAYYCRNTEGLFPDGRKGYLPSSGEWKAAYDNKSEVVACMSLIGGTSFKNEYYWSSSLADLYNAWLLDWTNGNVNSGARGYYNYYVRAVASLDPASYTPETAPNGVYVYSTDGKLYKQDAWDTANNDNAVGVGVVADECKFVISKQEASNAMIWGSTGTPAGCFMSNDESAALQDFAGEANTDAVIAAYGENANAAYYCRNTEGLFPDGRQGYLPSFGELRTAYDNKSEVVACMSLIGGAAFRNSYYWSSSLYDPNYAWLMSWVDGSDINDGRDYFMGYVRTFTSMS